MHFILGISDYNNIMRFNRIVVLFDNKSSSIIIIEVPNTLFPFLAHLFFKSKEEKKVGIINSDLRLKII